LNLLQESPGCKPFCRATWSSPLPGEEGAPPRRIIHSRGLRLSGPARIDRLGLRIGPGYYKCGSRRDIDWVTAFRVLIYNGESWKVIREERDLPRPKEETSLGHSDVPSWFDRSQANQDSVGYEGVVWYDLGGVEAPGVIVELRRSAIEGWWTTWQLAMGGVVLEGEIQGDPIRFEEWRLEPVLCNLDSLPEGVTCETLGGEVRYRSRFLEVGFRLRHAAMVYLALDDEGQGRTGRNLLRHGNLFEYHCPFWEEMNQGVRLWPVGRPETAGLITFRGAGETEFAGNRVTYRVRMMEEGQTYCMQWTVLEDRLLLSAERTGTKPVRAWHSAAWQWAFDSRVCPVGVVGRITHQGQTGIVDLPAIVHAPGYGTLTIRVKSGEGLWRSDSIRPVFATTSELKMGETPMSEGDYLLRGGKHQLDLELRVGAPALVDLVKETPPTVARALRRCAVTGLAYRPDASTMSNNANSTHGPFCLELFAAYTNRLGRVLPNLSAADLVRDSLDRWLDGGPGYWTGMASDLSHGIEEEYIYSRPACLLGLGRWLQANGSEQWLARHAEAVKREITRMRGQDLDGDGLLESAHRLGISGGHQWSTNWWDAISFGWKDAFSNALLYDALRVLAHELPRFGQTGLAEGLGAWADQVRERYVPAFRNPATGLIAGWRSMDSALHDYAFLFVNGAAVTAGLLDDDMAREVIGTLWAEMQRSGFREHRLGLPGNLWSIPDADMPSPQHYMSFGCYLNGGLTHSQARHFVAALYKVGMIKEGDEVLCGLLSSMADATAFGGCGSGVDWRMWDGTPCGYEGMIMDQFGILIPAMDRYAAKEPREGA